MAEREVAVLIDKETGDINNIRDKKLADSASQQSVASTDAIRMTTTTGEEVYIARDSFVQAIASVLNSNSQSTITTLFGADANGNHANINMANLASVLSAFGFPRDTYEGNANYFTWGSAYVEVGLTENIPFSGLLVCHRIYRNSDITLLQVIFEVNGRVSYRMKWFTNDWTWNDWISIK